MNTLNHEKLANTLTAGHVYRRSTLASLTTDIDRDLATLVKKGVLEKAGPGLYYNPLMSRYGAIPASDTELVEGFLQDELFLIYSWNHYNSLGLGLTQLYNRSIVYNRKRHGLFVLGGKQFDFRRPARGFPDALSKEFLLIDLVNNLSELVEDIELLKEKIKQNLSRFNQVSLLDNAKLYGKISTRKFIKELL